MAAVSFQQGIAADAANHLGPVSVGDRRDAKANVLREFDVNAAQAETDQRSENRVLGNANH
jgi:hypothetical protein